MDTPLYCATVLYPYQEGADFDFDLYARALIPMYVEVLGDNCVGYEVRRGLTSPGAPHVHFVCIANFWVESAERFMDSMGDHRMKEVMAQIAAFTKIQPIRQFDQVVGD